jgi:sigma-B regulation protein RsbU (phosphoserine phosphatase)
MAPATGSRILAVDDTPSDLELFAALLGREGYTLALAKDGPEALDMAAREEPDLILLDIFMPGMDGIETCRRLKADPATQDIPVIFVTGTSRSDEVLAGFEAGAVDYVTKPFRVPELLARVHVQAELRRVQREIRTLRGILPTCAHCKKIRDEKGVWHSIESYISQHSEAHFSHGICPDCISIHFPNARLGTAGPE